MGLRRSKRARYEVDAIRRQTKGEIDHPPTAKPQTSDQAPGEETVQVNDQYTGGGAPLQPKQSEIGQHQTGG